MDKIIAGTQDISVQVVFCNAGYIMTGCFRKFDVSAHIKNMECNATHGLRVSHHFLNRMADEGKKGCIVFTSSPAGCIPNALAVMYGSTKAFVSNFGASLAIEAAANGVDVHVFHPSPVHSRFLDGKTKLSAFDAAYKFAWTPEEVPLEVFKAIGSPSLLWDVGFFAVFTRYLTKVLDFNAFAGIMKLFGPWMGDYQKLVVPPKEKKN
jgi:short-subunit dehydrogenase